MSRKILREKEVCERVGVSRVTIWRWEQAGIFPRRMQIGPRVVGFLEDEVQAWIDSRQKV